MLTGTPQPDVADARVRRHEVQVDFPAPDADILCMEVARVAPVGVEGPRPGCTSGCKASPLVDDERRPPGADEGGVVAEALQVGLQRVP